MSEVKADAPAPAPAQVDKAAELKKVLDKISQSDASIVTANLADNRLDSKSCSAIANALAANTNIEVLNLSYSYVDDEGAKVLAPAIGKMPKLRELDVSGNEDLTDAGVVPILEALAPSKTLQSLNVSRNWRIASGTYKMLGRLLELPVPLAALDVGLCCMTPSSLEELIKALPNNKTLVSLVIQNNRLKDDGFKVLSKYLANNRILLKLDCAANGATADGTKLLADALKTTNISEFDICSNTVSAEGIKSIAETAAAHHNLNRLELRNIDMTPESKGLVVDAIRKNPFLIDVNFTGMEKDATDLVQRNKVFAINMTFVVGSISKQSTAYKVFFHHEAYDRNLLRIIFSYAN